MGLARARTARVTRAYNGLGARAHAAQLEALRWACGRAYSGLWGWAGR